MSKKANKTLIGAFVVGAIALLVISVAVFGSGKFFKRTNRYVLFFEGSVKGLTVGAPVIFKGVKLGTVKDISLIYDPNTRLASIPVVIETEPERIKGAPLKRDRENIQFLIKEGLRAQLDIQSFLTGQLVVLLDFFPDKPARLVGMMKEYTEIPTVPSPLDQLSKNIAELPLKEIAVKLENTIAGIDKIVNSKDAQESLRSINIALKDIRETLIYELTNTLKEVMLAARSVRFLVEYLEQHPEALLKGKVAVKGE